MQHTSNTEKAARGLGLLGRDSYQMISADLIWSHGLWYEDEFPYPDSPPLSLYTNDQTTLSSYSNYQTSSTSDCISSGEDTGINFTSSRHEYSSRADTGVKRHEYHAGEDTGVKRHECSSGEDAGIDYEEDFSLVGLSYVNCTDDIKLSYVNSITHRDDKKRDGIRSPPIITKCILTPTITLCKPQALKVYPDTYKSKQTISREDQSSKEKHLYRMCRHIVPPNTNVKIHSRTSTTVRQSRSAPKLGFKPKIKSNFNKTSRTVDTRAISRDNLLDCNASSKDNSKLFRTYKTRRRRHKSREKRAMPPVMSSSRSYNTRHSFTTNKAETSCVTEPLACDEQLLEFPSIYYRLACSGDSFEQEEIKNRLNKAGVVYRILDNGDVVVENADSTEDGSLVSADEMSCDEDAAPLTSDELVLSPPIDTCRTTDAANEESSSAIPPDTEGMDDSTAVSRDTGATDDSTAVSLFDLITSMSLPNDLSEISFEKDANKSEQLLRNAMPLPDDAKATNVSSSSLSSSNENVFRPLSDSTSMESGLESGLEQRQQEVLADLESALTLAPVDIKKTEKSDLSLYESPVSHIVGTLETCDDCKIERSVKPKVLPSDGWQQLAVGETVLPAAVCDPVEATGIMESFRQCLYPLVVIETSYMESITPNMEEAAHDTIVAQKKLVRESPTSLYETPVSSAVVEVPTESLADIRETSFTLTDNKSLDVVEGETAISSTETLLESPESRHVLPLAGAELLNTESHSVRDEYEHGKSLLVQPTSQAVNVLTPNSDVEASQPIICNPAIEEILDDEPVSSDILDIPDTAYPYSLTNIENTDKSVTGVGSVRDVDSEAFDGDESSEGEENSDTERADWPELSLNTLSVDHLLSGSLSPSGEELSTSEKSTHESSVDTVKLRRSSDSLRGSSPDFLAKSSPAKRKRHRKSKTAPPKSLGVSSSASPASASPAELDQSNSYLHDTVDQHDSTTDQHGLQSLSHDMSDVDSSDNDDVILTSAGLSEGPNWDYYQEHPEPVATSSKDPPYSTSTDPEFDIEPKLDDSVLQWDDELEDTTTLTLDISPREPSLPVLPGADASDSEDSDIEDLHYVIQQSSTQLLQADSALRKPRRDVVQCGIYLNPQKYVEWYATCQTNIKCLQVIQEHLETDQGLTNLTDDDIQQVLDLIRKWQSLEKLALERQDQSSTLCKVYRDLVTCNKLLKTCENQTAVPAFDDVTEVENHFRSLQSIRVNLQTQPHKLQQITDAIMVFEADNKKIKMSGFKEMLSNLNNQLKPTTLNLSKRTSELQYALVQWHKWNTDCRDLEACLVKTAYDIEPVEIAQCEQRLIALETSFSEFSSVCSDKAHNDAEETMTSIRDQVNQLISEKRLVDEKEEAELASSDIGQMTANRTDSINAAHSDDMSELRIDLNMDEDESAPNSDMRDDNFVYKPFSAALKPHTKTESFKSSLDSGLFTAEPSIASTSPRDDANTESDHLSGRPFDNEEADKTPEDSDLLPHDVDTLDSPSPLQQQTPLSDDSSLMSSLKAESVSLGEYNSVEDNQLEPDYRRTVCSPIDNDDNLVTDIKPLTIDVDGEALENDHPTPPTVEDLAPSLPITDKEKLKVAKLGKRSRKGRRKDKNKPVLPLPAPEERVDPNASLSVKEDFLADSQPLTFQHPEAETQTDVVETREQWSDGVCNESLVLVDSTTNTNLKLNNQSQTDEEKGAELSTVSANTDPVATKEIDMQTDNEFFHADKKSDIEKELPTDDAVGEIDPQTQLRNRVGPVTTNRVESVTTSAITDKEQPCGAASVSRLQKLSRSRKSRLERHLPLLILTLLFILAVGFLLNPKCCENTQYYRGIYGLRKRYQDLPPH